MWGKGGKVVLGGEGDLRTVIKADKCCVSPWCRLTQVMSLPGIQGPSADSSFDAWCLGHGLSRGEST